MDNPVWLPEKLNYIGYKGNWSQFINDAYSILESDLCQDKIILDSNEIEIDRNIVLGKTEAFRHIVEGRDVKGIVECAETIRRMERVNWIKPILVNQDSELVLRWENKRGRKTKVLLWLKDIEMMGYLVVLKKKKDGGLFLETAYPVNWPKRRLQLEKEYAAYIEQQAPSIKDGGRSPSTTW